MHVDPVPRRLTELTDATREALDALEHAEAADQRRRGLETLHIRLHALRQLEASHVEPLLMTQIQTRDLALACQKARSRVSPLFDELERTPVTDPGFDRILGRFAEALRRLLDRTIDLVANRDRLLSPEHRRSLADALAVS